MDISDEFEPLEGDYRNIGEPVPVIVTSRTELRALWTQRRNESSPHLDLRLWSVCSNGDCIPHRGGLRLTTEEAKALRDTLNGMSLTC